MVKRKKLLFVYYTMMLGGSTTSLLSLLESLDYDKYDVDLLLYRNEGPYFQYIPKQVNILPQACIVRKRIKQVIISAFDGTLPKAYMQAIRYTHGMKLLRQSMAYVQTSFCRKIEKKYDIAIGFLELWSDVFVNNCISAEKKISWVHVDYEKAHMYPDIDRNLFSKSDYIVNVSQECLDNFNYSFPEYAAKSIYIPNILTKQYLLNRIKNRTDTMNLPDDSLNLVSACRLAIDHKGLDRGIEAITMLIRQNYKITWYIIGDGPDREKLKILIQNNHIENNVYLLGQMDCPYSLYSFFDAFFVPSRFEGKPMAVTEAMMLELPPIVAAYASATEQIENGVDGIIADNSTDGIYHTLKDVCDNPGILKMIKENIKHKNYDNIDDLRTIDTLFDSL